MRILKKDLKSGVIRVAPENLDDLWHLSNIIMEGDVVRARTTREVKRERDRARPKKGRRLPLTLSLQVKEVAFDRSTDRLRVKGVVVEAPEKFCIQGEHHTVSILPRKPVSISKTEWRSYQLERLKRASELKIQPIIVVAIDEGEYCIAVLRHQGFDVKVEERLRLPGKRYVKGREQQLKLLLKAVAEELERIQISTGGPVVLAGPGFIKDDLRGYLKEKFPELERVVVKVGATSSAGISGVYESLRSGLLDSVAKHTRAAEETRYVEKVLMRLGAEPGMVSYGLKSVSEAAGYGAVETLLVVERLLRESSDSGRAQLERAMLTVEQMGGKVMVVSGSHEAGDKLWAIGGVAALLRYPVGR